jgi:hypothetical protein
VPPQGAEDAAHTADAAPHSFNQRLRCTGIRLFLKGKLPPAELALLCARRPLGVLQIEAPLAQAGDPHAIDVIGWLANGGHCEFLTLAATRPNHRAIMLALAQKNGATPQTVQRLDALLAEEEQGPTAEELEACRQGAEMLGRLGPGMIQQLVGVLGRSVQVLRGEDELDIRIEYDRKMLVRGDAEAEESLATDLLQKGPPDSQAEALTLLGEAADSSPSAKTALARCMPDPGSRPRRRASAARCCRDLGGPPRAYDARGTRGPRISRPVPRPARPGALCLGAAPGTPARRGMFRRERLLRLGDAAPSAAKSHCDVAGRRRDGAGSSD